jgi:RNA polymerase sigma factor (sigma-70 family)
MELEELVRRAQAGDGEAFAEICRSFVWMVKKYARQWQLGNSDADAAAQAWLSLVEAVREYRFAHRVTFVGFAESRVKYGLWNRFKKEQRRGRRETTGSLEETVELLADETDLEEIAIRHWSAALLREQLLLLPERQRQVVIRSCIGEEPLRRIGRDMGLTSQAVNNLRQRGLARLKKGCKGIYISEGGEKDGNQQDEPCQPVGAGVGSRKGRQAGQGAARVPQRQA